MPEGYDIHLPGTYARFETFAEYIDSYALRGFRKNVIQRKKPRMVKLNYRPKPQDMLFEQRPAGWAEAYRSPENFEDDMHPGEIAELEVLEKEANTVK
jgi:hypothetical protein